MARSPIPFMANARTVLAYHYLRKDEQGQVAETLEEMFVRVARVIVAVDQRYQCWTSASPSIRRPPV